MRGICKLTKSEGEFIRSHIIPKALTKPEAPGLPFVQSGKGTRPMRRWMSWYDRQLVTQAGEDELSKIDHIGIEILRNKKLIWSSWGPMLKLSTSDHNLIDIQNGWGFRKIEGINTSNLRLFILSILWRAAASHMSEFSEIKIPANDLEKLRILVLNRQVGDISFYPATLIQLSTIGEIHNNSPFATTVSTPSIGGDPGRKIQVFRFYFDGLVVHVHRSSIDDGYAQSLGGLVVGGDTLLSLSTVTYENSFQRENIEAIRYETLREWPDVIDRLLPPGRCL